jgi:NADPH2:quinone reductase
MSPDEDASAGTDTNTSTDTDTDTGTMRAARVPSGGEPFEIVDVPVPEPGPAEVRIAVDACGICHSDAYVREGSHPRIDIDYPRVPGHEIAGRVDAVGDDVSLWEVGDRVGVGWHGGHCFTCEPCRRGDFQGCVNAGITGLTFDGGYAEYAVVPAEAVGRVPEGLDAVDAAPLLCAGITTFNALRNADADAGDLVAVQGIGGLGHLGIQYARAMGFETVAISRSPEKEALARELGADGFIDATERDPATALQERGGARLVLATAPSADAIADVAGGIGRNGSVVAVGVPADPVEVEIGHLVGTRGSVAGWASGHATDWEDTLEFSALRTVTPRVETYPLAEAEAAYERMMANEARFRVVVEP